MMRAGVSEAAPLRLGLLILAVLSALATLTELAMERHWTPGTQLVPWVTLGLVAIMSLAVLLRPGRKLIRGVQVIGLLVLLSAVFGVWEHVESNFESGELDQRYSATWDTLPVQTRWWLAMTHEVGPSPPLAPAASAYAALTMLLATVRHPAAAQRGPLFSGGKNGKDSFSA
ncbi:MAG: hypothetical protein ACKVVP_13665 [Chloroflexota bacterium]